MTLDIHPLVIPFSLGALVVIATWARLEWIKRRGK